MEKQSLFQKKLLDKDFVYTAETTPPDASNKETLLKIVMPLKDVADAINITDSPGAKAHMSSLTAAIILAQNGDQPETAIVNDIDSLTLVSMANMMRREKKFPSGRVIDPSPKLFIGGAEVPTQGKPNTKKILNKINKGVDFFQTQYVFDPKILNVYMKVLGDAGILEKTNFIIGLGPFASAKSAKWMNDNLFGVDVPDTIIKRLESVKDQKQESKKICIELIEAFRNIQGVKGVHLMGHKKEQVIAEIIKESKN